MEEIELKVERAYPVDLGRGIIRLDPTTLLKLQLSPGDIVEIRGRKKTAAIVWKADRHDWDQRFVRIDNFIRQNAGVSIGEKVTIKKVEAPEAKKLILALPESLMQGGPELLLGEHANEIIKQRILKKPVFMGDIIPLINSMSHPITELTTSEVVPLIAVETDPKNTIVQVYEETNVELRDKATQTPDIGNETLPQDKIAININYATMSSLLRQLTESFKDNKKDDEVDIIAVSEAIVKTKDHSDKITRNIKEFNTKYNVEDNTTLSVLENVIAKSDKVIYEYIYTLKLKDAFNYINELDSKLEIYYRVALSEIAHRKIKEIEFQVMNPFLFSKLRKNYRTLVNELEELDIAGIQGTKDITDFISTSEKIMKKIEEIEDDLEDENKEGLHGMIYKILWFGLPILLSLYSLVAISYLVINPYLPLTLYISIFGVVCLSSKFGVGLNILNQAHKAKMIGFKNFTIDILLISVTLTIVAIILHTKPTNSSIHSLIFGRLPLNNDVVFLLTTGVLLVLFSLFIFCIKLKGLITESKFRLISEEICTLINKYELDTTT